MDLGLKTALLAMLGVGSLILALLGVIAATSGERRRRSAKRAAPVGDAERSSRAREATG